jgi:nucleotide-binding universal stress UspA family protein
MFARILVPLDRSPLAECVLPHAIAVSRYLGSQFFLFHILSLPDQQDRLQRMPALRAQDRPVLPKLTFGKPGRPCKRLTPGAKKRIIIINICSAVVSQVGFLSGTLAAHQRRFISPRLQLYLRSMHIVDMQPFPNPTGLNGKAAQSSRRVEPRALLGEEDCVRAMFDNILVPLDRSALAECVLPHTVAIARAFGSQVTLLSVLERGARLDYTHGVDPLEWLLRKAEAENYLRNLSDRLQQTGLPMRSRTLEGEAAEQIVDFAHNSRANLIILSSHGQSGLTGWNVGSVVQKIVLRAPTSIMIVRAYGRRSADLAGLRYQRLLVPMDGSQRAEWVWPLATTLARAEGAEILLAHVVRPPEMPRRLPPTAEDTELADRVVKRNQEEARRCVDELRAWMPASVRGCVLVGDHVPATLHRLADEEGVDLVILSAHGYSGGTRFPYGGVVTSFMIYGSTPVLIVQDVPADAIQPNPAEIRAADRGVLPMPHGTFDIEDSWQRCQSRVSPICH